AHWTVLLRAAEARRNDRQAKVAVYLPETAAEETFELERGDQVDVELGGSERRCIAWRLAKSEIRLLVDAQSHELVRMEVPTQQTVIELAGASVIKLAEKAQAEEVLARHFSSSNELFDDYLKVTALEAAIDV